MTDFRMTQILPTELRRLAADERRKRNVHAPDKEADAHIDWRDEICANARKAADRIDALTAEVARLANLQFIVAIDKSTRSSTDRVTASEAVDAGSIPAECANEAKDQATRILQYTAHGGYPPDVWFKAAQEMSVLFPVLTERLDELHKHLNNAHTSRLTIKRRRNEARKKRDEWKRRAEQAEAATAELCRMLMRYGEHSEKCSVRDGHPENERLCDCGLYYALAHVVDPSAPASAKATAGRPEAKVTE